ncbi:guanitoxin biosynthesis L-enduracididine beta-hydroxylase GntD [Micromonospora marina]|uniref:Arginine beta-hydroxylase, Fe(II)/alpha-ketoglutarate-dependent n=1 Tax=Micromonospora marina TaxID=307120 RepID=A0A1C4ZLB1_9ACTN|nr:MULTISPECIES: guanitoxin biosynthesis L-enduracididine beta-hydroxylase GntD [Micromonospora]SCF33897.1 arginine beta-hydroxylase, Fe(II)/alpha-ketoglutarate-dependent [Micromonospora marina]
MRSEQHTTGAPVLVGPGRLDLTPEEAAQVHDLVDTLRAAHGTADSSAFLRDVAVAGGQLPARLRRFLTELRTAEQHATCVISGFQVDDASIGPTPAGWSHQPDRRTTLTEEMWLVLCATALGDVFGWATQQEGALVHDICPAPGFEHSQLGSGSTELLWWHTEEAFHPLKCDYLGLLCLRNDARVPTTFATVENLHLDEATREVLFEPRFVIRPDDSHLEQTHGSSTATGRTAVLLDAARRRVREMNERPFPVAVLSGDPSSPYLSIDPFYMRVPEDDPVAAEALRRICAAIDGSLQEVALAPGEILFIDNFRAVHGRRPFQARYDGRDRWLKRVNITRDLRKSRAFRHRTDSRIIY